MKLIYSSGLLIINLMNELKSLHDHEYCNVYRQYKSFNSNFLIFELSLKAEYLTFFIYFLIVLDFQAAVVYCKKKIHISFIHTFVATTLIIKHTNNYRPIPNIVLCQVLQKTYKKCIIIYVLTVSLYKSCTTIENSKSCNQVEHYYLLFCSTSFNEIMYGVIQPTNYFKKYFQLMYLFSTLLFIML